MGKKVKVGKARKDKFYHLAKDTGYRSRASFKLLQLNRKFEFLERSSICIDLCAAPGGWLQVAQECMPTSSLLIGVDLVPIKPIHGVTTFQEDITSDKCKQQLKKILMDSKADIVLHDGAPNVGKNWLHDAYQQNELTLQALKLATEFLVKGGCFVTKVFRSKDYFNLMWVFNQMFKNVHATKPLASRNESAEMFVVCLKYLAPDVIDPKFLDPRHVFKDVEKSAKPMINLFHPEKVSKKVEGYDEGDYMLTNKLSATRFATDSNYLELLQRCTEIEIDDDEILFHPSTTNEIKECCKDIRVLGEKSIKDLRKWRSKIHDFLQSKRQKDSQIKDESIEVDGDLESDKDSVDEEFEKLQGEINDRERDKLKERKKKRKLLMKEKRKMRDKQELGMERPGDIIVAQDDIDLFSLEAVKRDAMTVFTRDDADLDEANVEDESDDEDKVVPKKNIKFDRHDVADYDDEGEAWDKIRNKEREEIGEDESDDDEKKMKNDNTMKKKVVKLAPAELAIGEEIIKSKKRKREIIDMSYNRFAYDDDDRAPDWFLQDERKHNKIQLPVTKEQIQCYKEKQKAIDANPIKKVAEARAKKKFKMLKKLEKARKKSESLSDEFSEKEKMRQTKEIYKKAGLLSLKKKEVTYVVAKKGVGKRVGRPAGVKGHFKVVDPRLKKDKRSIKNSKKSGKKGGRGRGKR